ncbi:serine/threonine-protein kinase [Amycolatopsis taiwanensis]|uniref:non-specific serine/threonine protein kinase n=1 Tax=Amycolatopsis taiwanensis TaxID=342230 RepID=A0A9W6R6S4_9PSEU|nr:serine/threonine-protein kinase [Amycolatopsis taiwanensis]GLY69360.1 serine/threonine protein kinase [Amycolatopsis taiwanensis]
MADDLTTQRTAARRLITGRYELFGELGRGGMGVVWRGEDTLIGRQVAIKEIRPPEGVEDSTFSERVMREVRNGGRINDPAVVTVYDVVSENGSTYIVMELVEAPTLAELVRAHGPLSPVQAATIGRQVLSALHAAHQSGIVHRDVKPGNIMVSPTGRVKLTDFGIAQAVDDPRLTTSGMIVGSPAFMAPERVAGNESVPASDLWSLGATLFFAVEGTVAFDRPTTAATLHAIMNEVPYLTRTQGPLASAIMGLLIASPEARISAAQADGLLAMAERDGAAGGTPAMPNATPHTLLYSAGNATLLGTRPAGTRRRPLIIAGAVLGVVLLAGGLFLGRWWGTPPADPARLPTLTYGADGQVPSFETSSSSYYCTDKPLNPGQGLGEDDWVDCKNLHFLQYYASSDIFGSSDSDAKPAIYPSDGTLQAWAESYCALEFYSKTGTSKTGADAGTLSYQALVPSRKTWDTGRKSSYSDDPVRRIYCLLGNRDGKTAITGSLVQSLK